MKFHRLPMNTPGLTVFLLKEASVLFSARSQSLYGLDAATTAALFALDAGEGGYAAAEELRRLLSEPPNGGNAYPTERERLPAPPPCEGRDGRIYRLLGTRFLLRPADPGVTSSVLPLLAHLEDTTPGPVDTVIDIEARDGHWQPLFNGVALDAPVPQAQLFPFLQGRLRVLAYQGTDFLLAIHGAVLERAGKGVLLPGGSGVGKSTLSMLLLAHGYRLLSDELAVIEAATRHALPVPMAAAAKSGSWPVLEPLYPELRAATEHRRWDGQRVRYIPATAVRFADRPASVDRIIFPRYEAGARLERRRLEPIEVLREISAAGYQIKGGLDADKAEALLDWLLDFPAFALRYGTSEQALEGVTSCLAA